MAARFFGHQPRTVAAVTGTNGKSSVVGFTRQIWSRLGHGAASIGTLGLDVDGTPIGPRLTTPDPVALHRTLAQLEQNGIAHLEWKSAVKGKMVSARVDIGGRGIMKKK